MQEKRKRGTKIMNQLETQERNELFDNLLEISDSEMDNEIKEYIYSSNIDKELLQELLPLYSNNAGKEWYVLADKLCTSKEKPEKWLEAVTDAFRNGVTYSVVENCVKKCSSEMELMQMIISSSESAAVSADGYDEREDGSYVSAEDTEKEIPVIKKNSIKEKSVITGNENFEVQAMETFIGYMDRQLSDEAPDLKKVEELISGAMHARDILKKYLERIKGLENMVVSQKQLLNQQMSQINEQKEDIQLLKTKIDLYKEQLSEKTAKEQSVSSLLEQLSHIR